MKFKLYTELYIQLPDSMKSDLPKTLKTLDKYLRDNLFIDNKYVTDSTVNMEEILIVDYQVLEETDQEEDLLEI
jgi:hypothetical protein